MRLGRFAVGAVGLAAAGLCVPAAAHDARASEAGQVIRSTTREVVLNLVVRDDRGRHVKDLKAGSVEVYENGVRQKITSFRYVPGNEVRESAGAEPKTAASVSAPKPLRPNNLICLVFHNIPSDAEILKQSLTAAQELFKMPLQPDTYIGVFRLDARLHALFPFTDNREALSQAARAGFMVPPTSLARTAETLPDAGVAQEDSAAGQASPDDTRAGIAGSMATTGAGAERSGQIAAAARQHMDQMQSMLSALSTLPGRKTVLLFSPGVINPEDPDLLKAVIERARAAQVTIYALDVRGPAGAQTNADEISRIAKVSARQADRDQSMSDMMENMRQGDDMMAAVRSSDRQATLRALAESTGGSLFATYDYRKPFERVLEDVFTHYELTYRPVSDKLDGRFRPIDVRLARKDLTVTTRAGYFALPEAPGIGTPAPFEAPALAALAADPRPEQFEARAAAFRFRPGTETSEYTVAFDVPPAGLKATPQPDVNRQRLHVSLLALVKDAGGQVIGKISRDFPVEVPDEQLAALRANSLAYQQPVKLPPGRFTIETAVVDHEANRASAGVIEIDNPPAQKGIAISSVVLVKRVEAAQQADASDPLVFKGQRVVPLLARTVPAGLKPYAYFVVYPDRDDPGKPAMQVQFLVNGQLAAEQTSDLSPPDATGAIPVAIGAPIKPGECELRITAIQGAGSATSSAKYTVTN